MTTAQLSPATHSVLPHFGLPQLDLPRLGLRGTLRLALVSLVVLFGVLGLWSAFTMISGAVVAQGQVMVKAQTQQLQSLDGGTVSALLVKNGDRVAKGQVLVQFDPALTQTSLDIALAKLADALTLQARLQAEQRGITPEFTAPTLPFPAPDLTASAAGQRNVFAARAALLQGQRDRLAETLAQQDSQLQGLKTQISAKNDQIALTETQVTNQQSLLDKGLTRQSALSDLRRGLSELLGQRAGLEAEQARLTNAKRDSTLETLQGERSFQEKVATDLGDATAKVQELVLEIVTRRTQLAHLDLRAPMDGVVHEMKLATLGGVVVAGGTVLDIIPLDQGMSFEVQVDPRGIDQVHPGQEADLILSSFDPRSTPRLKGLVLSVSPDAVVDPRSGHSFYRVDLDVPASELARLGDQVLMPGMPISAYLATSNRSVLAYLLHPLTSQMDLAFRDD
jgi:HlyD family secretion protein